MKFLKELWSVANFTFSSNSVRQLLLDEEYKGSVLLNKIRFIFFFLNAIPVMYLAFTLETRGGIYANVFTLIVYFTVAVIHFFALKKNNPTVTRLFNFLTVTFDVFIIFFVLIYWFQIGGQNDPAFLIKNPVILYFLLPISITLLLFRIALVFYVIILVLILYFGIIIYSFSHGFTGTNDWYLYITTNAVNEADAFITKPLLFLCLGVCMIYATYRTVALVRKIAETQSEKLTLERYFSPDILNDIIKYPEKIKEGRRIPVAILFLDIRGFTSMSEKMTPEELAEFLSEFRGMVIDSIFEFSGTVDKFIGDAVMATFGTPFPSEKTGEDNRNAINASLSILRKIKLMNSYRKTKELEEIKVGIGIHYGDVFAGNIGKSSRIEYTVIGDSVNIASRLESLCKEFSAQLIISDSVYKDVKPLQHKTEQKTIQVRGKSVPMNIYIVSVES